ncbi:hypothetical protein IFM89_021169 [Coptis chinensis]|uniref:Myb-like domain-containing protein n=1 Tax=Coptis chinensis TaxID=261450 RepID=A0A835HD63_9MAGN|nr:hypothetical protein IFM89_021169 [Coptis chinensis]
MEDDMIDKRWVLEFLLRQAIEDNVINLLLPALAPTINDHRMMKTFLLRRIRWEIEKGLVSEKILETLELIEELDYREGVGILDSMKEAYCAVAVECVVMYLREEPKNMKEYSKAVDRIWRGRLSDMEKGEKVSLVSSWSKDLTNVLEVAVRNVSVCEYFSKKDTRNDALKLVRVFMEEVTKEMGPSFLELLGETMCEKGADVPVLTNTSTVNQVCVGEECSFLGHGDNLGEINGDVSENDFRKMDVDSSVDNPCVTTMTYNPFQTSVCPKVNEKGKGTPQKSGPSFLEPASNTVHEKAVAIHFPDNTLIFDQVGGRQESSVNALGENLDEHHGTFSGDEISQMEVDSVEGDPHITTKKYTLVLTPDFRKIQEALNSSVLDLHDMVNDPLPDALFMAATISADLAKEKATNVHAAEHRNEVDMDRCDQPVDKECGAVHVSRPSLMERNGTARTYEWEDDTIHSSSQGSPNRPRLPNPRRRLVTPLKRKPNRILAGRRKPKKWSLFEEQALIDAVKEYGRGNWSVILDNNREIFEERTAGDLKDKWLKYDKIVVFNNKWSIFATDLGGMTFFANRSGNGPFLWSLWDSSPLLGAFSSLKIGWKKRLLSTSVPRRKSKKGIRKQILYENEPKPDPYWLRTLFSFSPIEVAMVHSYGHCEILSPLLGALLSLKIGWKDSLTDGCHNPA